MEGLIEGPGKRRRRPKVSCTSCRRRKIRCNRERPCSNCSRTRLEVCVYEDIEPFRVIAGKHATHTSSAPTSNDNPLSHPSSSWTTSPSVSGGSAQDAEATTLRLRIQELEIQLAKATLRPVLSPPADSSVETTDSRVSGPFHVHYKKGESDAEPIVNGVSIKTRFFGQSHWCVSIADLSRDFFNTFEPYIRRGSPTSWLGLEKCKSVARRIKARRSIYCWTTMPSGLPSRAIADALVDHYFQTIESLYRILHIPTFRRNYEELWMPGAEQDGSSLIQLKLVLALGSVTYDDRFTLRLSAIQWVHEAQSWISGPKHKARLTLQAIQTSLLLLLAQERVGVDGDPTWVSSGALLRKAMHMGLHRDPRHHSGRTVFAAEMQRRLWNTVLEINLQSSLTYGGAPLISSNDFDTSCPGNFADEQLETQDPIVKPDGDRTLVSLAIAFRKTFPQRLAVVKYLNDLASPASYKETLQLDVELRKAYRELSQTLRTWIGSSISPPLLQYETTVLEFIMQRYFSALHAPYFGPTHGPAYAFSQQAVLEASLKLWGAACPPNSSEASDDARLSSITLTRLVVCSAGFYQTTIAHATYIISLALRMQLQEDSLCPTPLRPELFTVVDDAKAWCLNVIGAGGTSVKGYLMMGLLTAQVEGLRHGLEEEKIAELLGKAIEDVEQDCLPILEEVAAGEEKATEAAVDVSTSTPVDITGPWDLMTFDAPLNLDGTDPMSWIFNEVDSGVTSV